MSRARVKDQPKVDLESEEVQSVCIPNKYSDLFERYIKFISKKPAEEDDEVVVYERVEISEDLCPKEGKLLKGEKYLRVDLMSLTGDVVFRLKSGGCRIVSLSEKNPPLFAGEHKNSPTSV
jgi:hypothetical protein